ncbi:sensor domain-containing protein [Ferdinandcohnia quinoae]|uniref:EAL domain-containing protein n=1 Tax=Fredinandcohnia quinoae TaxID=2918902 RepID=A0AAW5E5J0_9BACI|nr:EAL domain-containing protein [Fredinandcohnia sp. SECRCQ15]MCH1626510.1 EAL domain-containing protein [Fredinandcohnia sp. SECRCQ15]
MDMKIKIEGEKYSSIIHSLLNKVMEIGEEWTEYSDFCELIEEIDSELYELINIGYAIDQSFIISATDDKGKIIYVNDKFVEMFKYKASELIGKRHRILNSGYHDNSFFRDMWNIIQNGEVWTGEIKNKAKDGSFYWVNTAIVPLLSTNGDPSRYIVFGTDISQRKESDEKLVNALKNDFELVVNTLQNLVFKVAKDDSGNFIYLFGEGKLAYQLGVQTDVIYKKGPRELFPEYLADLLEKSYEQGFRGTTLTYNYSFNKRYLQSTLSPKYEGEQIIELIGCCNDMTELYAAQEEIKFLSFYDTLTNLPNRRKFNDDISKLISKFKKEEIRGFSIFLVNLDRFKNVNDSLGHTVGDKLLIEVKNRLLTVQVEKGCLYRLTGDQFIILCTDMYDELLLEQYAMTILDVFDSPFNVDQTLTLHMSCCIGACVCLDDEEDPDSLFKKADTALHTAKSLGKNTYKKYEQKMKQHYDEYLLIEYYLPIARQNDEFELYFQPKLDLTTNSINGMEALLRWDHPILGNVPPSKFIPIAEETGHIIKIDEWVLKKACLQNKKWSEGMFQIPLRVAVNISPLHFRHPNFVNMLERVLKETNLEPEFLEIEITENTVIDNIEECIACVVKLREMGVIVSIDDFGTGYSALSYLKNLPINCLKIDQSFIKEIAKNIGDIAIVKAIICLAHEMGLKVVAEGVEEKETLECLNELGCDEIQGYYVSRPMPSSEFEKKIIRG